ncbi:hypothetical protein [Alcaligenes faecalis]|uniref:hypothetical protein n=1 Tax=Alcaligenes faecalis TaxID=511 RepID=UPI00203AEA9F|nr:hypothetical protein [Alcaligenes faecalis]MCM2621173.1 hypothetical protein [Alcaligenes faecalis]
MSTTLQTDCLATAQRLLQARQEHRPIEDWPDALRPVSFDQAYRVQAVQMKTLGPIGGWKVGAANSVAPPPAPPCPSVLVTPARMYHPARSCPCAA